VSVDEWGRYRPGDREPSTNGARGHHGERPLDGLLARSACTRCTSRRRRAGRGPKRAHGLRQMHGSDRAARVRVAGLRPVQETNASRRSRRRCVHLMQWVVVFLRVAQVLDMREAVRAQTCAGSKAAPARTAGSDLPTRSCASGRASRAPRPPRRRRPPPQPSPWQAPSRPSPPWHPWPPSRRRQRLAPSRRPHALPWPR
jgi:hypothetical protein